MNQFTFYNPVRLFFGEGQFESLGEHAAALGSRPLIVTGRRAMRQAGWLDRAHELLTRAGLQPLVFDQVPPNPTSSAIEAGAALARRERCDIIIGLGGGSSMDAAKAIAVRATHDEPIVHYVADGPWSDKRTPTSATLPIICVTSTAGTSSELTRFAVVTDEERCKKAAVVGDAIYPRIAIADPRLTYTMPPRVTAATGVDVFCHAFEAYTSRITSPIVQALALRAISLVARWLPEAVADGDDRTARHNMLLANVFAGYALSQAGATAVHALEHPISALHPEVAHGEGLAALLPAYVRTLAEAISDRLAAVAEAMGLEAAPRDAAEALLRRIEELLDSVNLRVSLAQLGVAEDELETIAAGAEDYMAVAVQRTPLQADHQYLLQLLSLSL